MATRTPSAGVQDTPGTTTRPLRVQLWSYNYDPEPTGIGPVSRAAAQGLMALGHDVEVVAAHPHYPEPRWGVRRRPYREVRDGVRVLRLPLWVGRANAMERYRQEVSFMAAQAAVAPLLPRPDVMVAVSPSFPALLPAILYGRARRLPWVLWLHDILPDGATSSGLVDETSPVIRVSRKLESAAYRHSERIVVLSSAFTANLTAKGVPTEKIDLVYDPATRTPKRAPRNARPADAPLRILSMGNIGYSQGLADLVGAFERASDVNQDVGLRITGNGMAADDVRAQLSTGRVDMLGLLSDEDLEDELHRANVAIVTQRHTGAEFNIPSKIMNFMAYGLPIIAAVNPGGEVAHIVRTSGAGWIVDSSDPDALPRTIAEIDADRTELKRRGTRARAYAREYFTQDGFSRRFAASLQAAATRSALPTPAA